MASRPLSSMGSDILSLLNSLPSHLQLPDKFYSCDKNARSRGERNLPMYKVLLVEDEKVILQDLYESVCWEKVSVTVTAVAQNGAKALELFKTNKPDIVITDIRMPVMDGIALTKSIREQYGTVPVIYLTGYDEKKYMQEAIEAEAVAYITKPFTESAVLSALEKAISRLKTYNSASIGQEALKEKRIKEAVFGIDPNDEPVIGKGFLVAVFKIDNFGFHTQNKDEKQVTVMTDFVKKELEKHFQEYGHTLVDLEQGKYLLILYLKEFSASINPSTINTINTIFLNHYGFTVSVGICDVPMVSLREAYLKAMEALGYLFYYPHVNISIYSAIKQGVLDSPAKLTEYEEKIIKSVCSQNSTEYVSLLNNYFEIMRSLKLKKHTIRANVFSIICKIYDYYLKVDEEMFIREKGTILNTLETYDNINDMKKYIEDIIALTKQGLTLSTKLDNSKHSVQLMVHYIEANFSKPISLEEISSSVYISSSVARRIFKSHMGKTIHEYLTDVRMKNALLLISESSVKIKDLAVRVGFDNVSYFCMVFSKYYGLTPDQYKRKLRSPREGIYE